MKEILQLLAEKIKNKKALTEIEFKICDDKLKKKYIKIFLNPNPELSLIIRYQDWVSEYLNEEEKEKIIYNKIYSGEYMEESVVKKLNDNDVLLFLKNRITKEGVYDLHEWEKELAIIKCPELLIKEIEKRIKDNDYVEFEHFLLVSEEYKLLFILNEGLFHLNDDYKKWFKNWKKATNRDLQIEAILKADDI